MAQGAPRSQRRSILDDIPDATPLPRRRSALDDIPDVMPPVALPRQDRATVSGIVSAVGRQLERLEPYAIGGSIGGHALGWGATAASGAFPPIAPIALPVAAAAHGVGAISDYILAGQGSYHIAKGIQERNPLEVGGGALEALPVAGRVSGLIKGGVRVAERLAVPTERAGRLAMRAQPPRSLEDRLARELSGLLRTERGQLPTRVSLPTEQLPSGQIGVQEFLQPPSTRVAPIARPIAQGVRSAAKPESKVAKVFGVGEEEKAVHEALRRKIDAQYGTVGRGGQVPAVEQALGAAKTARTALDDIPDMVVPGPIGRKPMLHVKEPVEPIWRKPGDFERELGPSVTTPQDLRALSGSEEAARRLGMTREELLAQAPGPSRVPLAAEEGQRRYEFLRRTLDPKGQVHPQLLARIAGAGVGAAIGATQGETDDERAANAILFGAGGAFVPSILKSGPPIASVVKAARAGATSPQERALWERWRYFSMLARPLSVINATSGAFSGAAVGAMVRAGMGDLKGGANILRALLTESPRIYLKALANPNSIPAAVRTGGRIPQTTGILSLPTRFFMAADAAATHAMTKGGIPVEEALRYTLSGGPTSKFGQSLFKTMSEHTLGRLAHPFIRVGIQGVERGLEFSPLGPFVNVRAGQGIVPLSLREKIVRGIVGTGVSAGMGSVSGAIAGRIQDDKTAGRFRRTTAAMTGPVNLTTLLVSAWAEAAAKFPGMPEKIPPKILQALLYELPLTSEGDIRGLIPFAEGHLIPRSFVPSFAPSIPGITARPGR